MYLDNKKSTTGIPDKSSEYIFDKYVCSDDSVALNWDSTNWNYSLTNIGSSVSCALYFIENTNIVNNFVYTGSSQEWVVPKTGKYKMELWGANISFKERKLNSSYVSGEIILNKYKKLYLFIGGTTSNIFGGFNGGGNGTRHPTNNSYDATGGAGGTDIRILNGNWNDSRSLSSRIIIASGSAGNTTRGTMMVNTSEEYLLFGSGGALTGISTIGSYSGIPGTQTNPGGVNSSYYCGGS